MFGHPYGKEIAMSQQNSSDAARPQNAPLTEEAIAALIGSGAKRWQKNGMDRLYLSVYRLGLRIDKRDGSAWWGNEAIPANYLSAVKDSHIWVDAKTGILNIRLGTTPDPLPGDIRKYYQTVIRQNANEFIERAYRQAEWERADHNAMSIKTVALKWRKGQIVTIDDKRMIVEDVGVDDGPFSGSARMICDARLVVRQYDGKFRRVDLNEVQ